MGDVAPEINSSLTQGELVLTPGDVLAIRFPRQPQWDQQNVVILASGQASFLSLGNLPAAGMTLAMLDKRLSELYAEILTQPDFTIRVTHIAPRTIAVVGEVQNPGSFPLPPGRLSLPEAVALAGGFVRDTARLDQTLLVRWIPKENRIQSWTLDASVEEWSAEEAILMRAHDVIYIPAKPIVHVNDWIDRYIRRLIPFPYLVGPQ
jgi:polysaccharide export outer membrane protein